VHTKRIRSFHIPRKLHQHIPRTIQPQRQVPRSPQSLTIVAASGSRSMVERAVDLDLFALDFQENNWVDVICDECTEMWFVSERLLSCSDQDFKEWIINISISESFISHKARLTRFLPKHEGYQSGHLRVPPNFLVSKENSMRVSFNLFHSD
jgi:hypothetical protein